MFFLIRCLIFVLSRCKVFYAYVLNSIQLSGLNLRSIVVLVPVLCVQFNQNFETSAAESFISFKGICLVLPSSQSTKISNLFSVIFSIETSSVKSTRFASTAHNSFFTTCLYRIHILLLISLVNEFDTISFLNVHITSGFARCRHYKPHNPGRWIALTQINTPCDINLCIIRITHIYASYIVLSLLFCKSLPCAFVPTRIMKIALSYHFLVQIRDVKSLYCNYNVTSNMTRSNLCAFQRFVY